MREVQSQIESFSEAADSEENSKKRKEMEVKLKVAKKSSKYLNRTSEAIKKMLKEDKSNKVDALIEYSKNEDKK